MSRLLAFIGAVAMVVGAMAIRDRIDERPGGKSGAPAVLVCATELERVCAAFAGTRGITTRSEPAGTTAAQLSAADAADPGLDGWLVPSAWTRVVDDARARASLPPMFGDVSPPLARSPLVIVGAVARLQALATHCGRAAVDLKCVGDAATKASWAQLGAPASWGDFKPFQADPTRDSSGLLALAAQTIAFHGRSDVSAVDLDEDAYLAWLRALSVARPYEKPAASAVQDLLTIGASAVDVVLTLESDVGPAVASSARRSSVQVIYPSPVVTADVVLARRVGGAGEKVADLLEEEGGEALAANGWRVADRAPEPGVGRNPLPAGDGLPGPGLLAALQSKWREASR